MKVENVDTAWIKKKSSKNVTSDPRLSFLHTAYLSKHPLVVDSLYEKWQLHLKQQSLSGTFCIAAFGIR